MSDVVTREEFEACFGYTMNETCKILSIEMKDLKRLCRKYGVTKWPKKTKLDLNFMKVYKEENFQPKKKPKKKKKVEKSNTKNVNLNQEVASDEPTKIHVHNLLSENEPKISFSDFKWMSKKLEKE